MNSSKFMYHFPFKTILKQKTMFYIGSIREYKNSDKPLEKATRYYISSLEANAEKFQNAIRLH